MTVALGRVGIPPKFTAERSLHKTPARCSNPKSGESNENVHARISRVGT
jgi:hypothetical protein